MSQRDLAKVWQKFSTYLVVYAFATMAVIQGTQTDSGVSINQPPLIAALFGLLICIPLYCVCIWFASRHAENYGNGS